MMKKISVFGILGLMLSLNTAFAGDVEAEYTPFDGMRFTCSFQSALPVACTAFGEIESQIGTVGPHLNDNLTVICGNLVVYSEGVYATFPTSETAELRSIIPGAVQITIKALNPNAFEGTMPAILTIPASPQSAVTGVCHMNYPRPTPVPGLNR